LIKIGTGISKIVTSTRRNPVMTINAMMIRYVCVYLLHSSVL